ncbi:MAG: hypothetical protein JGK17_25540 [Microcoleus sp. PH2017_10_PVI_O_A]|nr:MULTISPECIES: hypothetical protein [unclassified Microcoleus]MCC3543701.1 hypothetical protein [Microcoleus sp. PH2017_22_RUC_O_B]MCC3562424.1 hypothetical protein [Microcoleus sp. PH2017_27_LUM_O_A]MCC3408876.1 hypothetical protein [Microcoleus sp. PH2017_10_PVI_O_A]MCC3463010.1 hypothetical protein [Microcoleus sp. PH2017_11_PCY_U_A]MCC3481408.1 hypothetical protein [Microcoleus sp. PH2017_12_PCY_D_A]
MYGCSGLRDRPCVSSEFTACGSPVAEIGTATSQMSRLKFLKNRCLQVCKCPVPVPDDKSGLAIAPNTFDSWQISKCQANDSQPIKKSNPKNKTSSQQQ